MALTICTWWWGDKFGISDVEKLAAGVRRHLKMSYRFACIHDKGFPAFSDDVHCSWPIPDEKLTKVKGCFARLRMFDPIWQQAYPFHFMYNDAPSNCIVCIDLDTVITGSLDELFNRNESFLILQGGNAANPCKFNGALQMLRAGAYPEVWQEFTLDKASKVPFYDFPDDQGWIWHKLPNAAGWTCGKESGVYVFRKPGWPVEGDSAPSGARLVTFSGWRNPEIFKNLPWVKEHWHA